MNHIEPRPYTDEQYRQSGVLGDWNTLLDIYNAVHYGYAQYRLPTPGKPIDVAEAETHIAKVEREWEAERQKRDPTQQWTGAPPFLTMPLNAKLFLHSVLLEGGLSTPESAYKVQAIPDRKSGKKHKFSLRRRIRILLKIIMKDFWGIFGGSVILYK